MNKSRVERSNFDQSFEFEVKAVPGPVSAVLGTRRLYLPLRFVFMASFQKVLSRTGKAADGELARATKQRRQSFTEKQINSSGDVEVPSRPSPVRPYLRLIITARALEVWARSRTIRPGQRNYQPAIRLGLEWESLPGLVRFRLMFWSWVTRE